MRLLAHVVAAGLLFVLFAAVEARAAVVVPEIAVPEPLISTELSDGQTVLDQTGKTSFEFNPTLVEERLNARFTSLKDWTAAADARFDKDQARIDALEQQVQSLTTALSKLEAAQQPQPSQPQPSQQPAVDNGVSDSIAKLAARVTKLESTRNRVTAPFSVVDDAGKSIFEVEGGEFRGWALVDGTGGLVASGISAPGGGVLRVNRSGRTGEFASLRAFTDGLGVKVTTNGADGAQLDVGANGQASLQMMGKGGIASTLDSDENGGRIEVFNNDGQTALTMASEEGGGVVTAQKPGDDGTHVAMGVTTGDVGLRVKDGGHSRAYIGTSASGPGVAYVFGSTEVPSAGLQSYDNGKGEVAVFNSSGMPIAFLDESDKHAGGGNVTLTDPAGNGVFSAGFDGEQGAACVGHKDKLHCLGIGLPGMGTGNQ